MKIALLGARCTGKTQLAGELAAHFRLQGKSVAIVAEALHEWCRREGRAPRPEEHLPIAREQERGVDDAAKDNAIVIADSTALMVAIHSGMLFEGGEPYRFALERQRRYDVTLLTGLDLPWPAAGPQREGPRAREPMDALIRQALAGAGVAYRVVYGQGQARLANAVAAIDGAAASPGPAAARDQPGSEARRSQWNCEKCSDPQCEHRLFTQLSRRSPE